MNWTEVFQAEGGGRGWELALPRFSDEAHPENALRMNRFYDSAADGMRKAARSAMETGARRVRYRCHSEVSVVGEESAATGGKHTLFRRKKRGEVTGRAGDIRVVLRLTLSVSGQWTREKVLLQLWRDGALLAFRRLPT